MDDNNSIMKCSFVVALAKNDKHNILVVVVVLEVVLVDMMNEWGKV